MLSWAQGKERRKEAQQRGFHNEYSALAESLTKTGTRTRNLKAPSRCAWLVYRQSRAFTESHTTNYERASSQ